MKLKPAVLAILSVLLVPVVAAVEIDLTETFEGFTVGTSEPDVWGGGVMTWSNIDFSVTVQTDSQCGGGKCLRMDASDNTNAVNTIMVDDYKLAYERIQASTHTGPGTSDLVFVDFIVRGVGGNIFDVNVYESNRVNLAGVGDIATCASKPLTFDLTDIDWVAEDMTVTIYNGDGSTCHTSTRVFSNSPTSAKFEGFTWADNDDTTNVYTDNWVISGTFLEPPDGLEATTYSDGVVVKVELALDDTDDTGGQDYILQRDSGSGFVTIATLPAGSAIGRVFTYGDSTASGSTDYRAFAQATTNIASCTVTVDASTPGSTDTCGNFGELPSGGDAFGDQGWVYGGDKQTFADAWKLTTDGLDLLYGTFLVLFFMGAAYRVSDKNTGVTIGGAAAGVMLSFAFGLFSVWIIVFTVVAAIGAAILRQRMMGGGVNG